MYISIDSTVYSIPFEIIHRKAEFLYKSAERTEDGILHSELIGVYYNYDLEMAESQENFSDYVDLWQKLTEPVESHTVTIPDEDGFHTFSCYFANIRDDEYKAKDDGSRGFRGLSFSVIATAPARTP